MTVLLAKIILAPMWVTAIYGTIAFVLGACVGSFLNVVIYRVPRGISVNTPRRSFCPACDKTIPMYLNIPLVSWVMLKARCRYCGAPIAFRYFVVELVTALFFLAVWVAYPFWQVAPILWILMSLLIAATFIDLEHYIIPDSITIGGAIAGMVCAFAVPGLLRESEHLSGLGMSALGAVAGYGLVWMIVQLGKLAFGRVKESFEEPVEWSIGQKEGEEEPMLALGEESTTWSDFFFRPSDKIVLECPRLKAWGKGEEKEWTEVTAMVFHDRLEMGEETIQLEDLEKVEGETLQVVIPREAMGYGDVKFMAMIGAFLGWQAVLFTILAGSVSGALVGLLAKAAKHQEWSSKIPFGPFLAAGAVVWVFFGRELVHWYFFRIAT